MIIYSIILLLYYIIPLQFKAILDRKTGKERWTEGEGMK